MIGYITISWLADMPLSVFVLLTGSVTFVVSFWLGLHAAYKGWKRADRISTWLMLLGTIMFMGGFIWAMVELRNVPDVYTLIITQE